MPQYHVLAVEETTFGTWNAPTDAYPLLSWSHDDGTEYVDGRETGASRGLRAQWYGSRAPSGSGEGFIHEEDFALFAKAAGLWGVDSLVVGATSAYEHNLIVDDSLSAVGLSMQVQSDASNAFSFKGVVLDTLTFSLAAREKAKFSFDWLAFDAARVGGTWDDTTAAPAIIGSPAYFGAAIQPLKFNSATLTWGGTVAFDAPTKKITITGGTSITLATMVEISIENNFSYQHTLGSASVPTIAIPQDRSVTGRMDIDFSTVTNTYYDAMINATEVALQLTMTGNEADTGENYTVEITLPSIVVRSANHPDITGEQTGRSQSVEFTAHTNTTANADIGVRIVDTATTWE